MLRIQWSLTHAARDQSFPYFVLFVQELTQCLIVNTLDICHLQQVFSETLVYPSVQTHYKFFALKMYSSMLQQALTLNGSNETSSGACVEKSLMSFLGIVPTPLQLLAQQLLVFSVLSP